MMSRSNTRDAVDKRLRNLELASNARMIEQLPTPVGSPPGIVIAPAVFRPPTILELSACTRLGVALGVTWLTHSAVDGELKVMSPVPDIALNDNAGPGSVIVHDRHVVPEHTEEIPGANEWSPSKKNLVRAQLVDVHYRAQILPVGSFEAAQAKDAAAAARAQRARDPDRQAAQARRLKRAKARQRWLHGYDIDRADLGLD